MFRQLLAILDYYKILASWSFAVNIIITIMNPSIFYALSTKFFIAFLLWYFVSDTSTKNKLSNNKKIMLSNSRLFFMVFFIDSLITIPFILIIKGFI